MSGNQNLWASKTCSYKEGLERGPRIPTLPISQSIHSHLPRSPNSFISTSQPLYPHLPEPHLPIHSLPPSNPLTTTSHFSCFPTPTPGFPSPIFTFLEPLFLSILWFILNCIYWKNEVIKQFNNVFSCTKGCRWSTFNSIAMYAYKLFMTREFRFYFHCQVAL